MHVSFPAGQYYDAVVFSNSKMLCLNIIGTDIHITGHGELFKKDTIVFPYDIGFMLYSNTIFKPNIRYNT